MPTGYTAAIKDGITFKQYALSCARAFGALILMRDESHDAPIPERFEPTDYHLNALTDARADLFRLEQMSDDEAEQEASRVYQEGLTRTEKYIAEANELRVKYEAMLIQARSYRPPTLDHKSYAAFMVEQIESSIKNDCDTSYWTDHRPVPQSGAEYRRNALAEARRQIAYHTAEHAKEVERTNTRNAWIKALRDSLS